jgi:hypothetical protein
MLLPLLLLQQQQLPMLLFVDANAIDNFAVTTVFVPHTVFCVLQLLLQVMLLPLLMLQQQL